MTITSGIESSGEQVTKRDLVGRLQTLFQADRLRIAKAVPMGDVLERELTAFSARITPKGRDTYEALREGDHDDLVVALALSVYFRDRRHEPRYVDVESGTLSREAVGRRHAS